MSLSTQKLLLRGELITLRRGSNSNPLTDSCALGGPHLLDGHWRELRLDELFGRALRDRWFEAPVERTILAVVAQRALAPESKLAGARWAGCQAWIPGLEQAREELEGRHFSNHGVSLPGHQ